MSQGRSKEASMKRTIHRLSGITATLTIAAFFSATVIAELSGSMPLLVTVKGLIVAPGLFVLIPAIATAGGTGFRLARGRKGTLTRSKKRRMPLIAANGIFILTPCAIVLRMWALEGVFDARFFTLQALELLAGAVNLILMGLNIRDGLRLSVRRRRSKQ